MIQCTQDNDDVLLAVKVVPNASRDKIAGELEGMLKVTVSAAAERGAANKAVCKLIAKALGLRSQQVTVETGRSSPRKTLRLEGQTIATLEKVLRAL